MSNHIQGMIVEPFDYPVLQEQAIRQITTIVEFNDPSVPHGLIMSRKSISSNEMEQARDSGRITLSGKVKLALDKLRPVRRVF